MSPRVAHVTTVDDTLRFLLLGQLRALREEGFDVTAISAPGRWVADLRREGIRHVAWTNATRAWSPLTDLRAFVELVGILRRGRFDVVHTHNPKPGVLGRIAARLAGVPVVVNTVHGFYASPEDPLRRRAPVMALEWLAARFSHAELYQSREDLEWARRLRVAPDRRTHHLGNGTDLRTFDDTAIEPETLTLLRKELGLPAEGPVVGTIGRLVREKGYEELLLAARAIRAERPEVSFLAVGPFDPKKDDAISSSQREAASSDIVFTGWREDVPDLLALMDVFVLASWREGMPRSAIEAAAMGRAMVLTDIRGCREVARDRVEALLVPPRHAGALTEAIRELLGNGELRRGLGAAARERARREFHEHAVARRVVDVYQTLLPHNGEGARRVSLPGRGDVTIRRATRADVTSIAVMHRELLPDAFLPQLGLPFLRVLFRALVQDPDAPTLVAELGGEVVGYTAAVTSMSRFRRRFVRRYGVIAALLGAPALLRPGVLRRLVELLRYPDQTRGLPEAEWVFLAVRAQGRGLGRLLGEAALDALVSRGVREVKTYVFVENVPSQKVVTRLGFQERGDIVVHEGHPSLLYVYRCPS